MESVEERAGKEIVEGSPLEGACHTLDLLGREGHGGGNDCKEEGGGGGGRVVGDGGEGARGDLLTNKVSRGFRNGRGFFGAWRVEDKVGVGECGSEVGGLGVAVRGGFGREGEDVVDVDVRVEGDGVVGIKKGVHDGVCDGRDVIPAKWRDEKREVDRNVGGGEKREDEKVLVGGGEAERPVKIGDISAVEEDVGARTEGRFEGVEVGEGEVFGKEREEGVGIATIKNCSKLGGALFRSAEVGSSGWLVGDGCTVDAEKIHGHVPEGGDVLGGREGRWRGGLNTGSGEVDM